MSSISLSTACVYLQYKTYQNTKNSKINGVTINWFEGGTAGGTQDVASINFNNRFLVATSSWTSYNDKIDIYDKNKAWTRFTNIPVSSFFANNNKLFVCSSTQPIVLQMFVPGGSEGNNFLAYWKSGNTHLTDPDLEKWLRYVFFTGTQGTGKHIFFDYSVNSSTVTVSKCIDFTTKRNIPMLVDSNTFGKNFTFKISNSTSTFNLQTFTIYSLEKELNPLR